MIKFADFKNSIGKKVKFSGKIAKALWQHLTTCVETHPIMNYIDLDEKYQIIVYTQKEISCKNEIEITGKVIKVESEAGDPRYKISDEFFEYQLIADSWKCI